MSQPIGATGKAAGGERVASYTSQWAAERAVEQLAADSDLVRSVWIRVSKLDSHELDSQEKETKDGSNHGIPTHGNLAAAFGVGALIGSLFLILTLIGLSVLAWAVLGLVMVWALTDTALVALGASRAIPFSSWADRSRRPRSYDVMANPAIAGQVARVLATGPHPPSG
jgi:hypothetical protein